MSLRVYYEVLNQKGSPALYTDTFANRPAFGFQGRLFISNDTGQIFEDTGTAWTLVADAGVGGGTLSSVTANGNTTAFGIVITANGLTANAIIKSGGTANQFLKADGSVDSSSYVPYTGATADLNLGSFDLTTDIAIVNQVKAVGSGGLSFNSNNGTQIASMGAGGGANLTFYGGFTGTTGSLSTTIDEVLKLNTSSSYTRIAFYNQNVERGRLYYNAIDSQMTIGTYVTGGSIKFETDANVRAMTILSNGNVLINSTATDGGQKLQVNGSFKFISLGGVTNSFNGDTYSNGMALANKVATTGSWDHFYFQNPNGNVGVISTNGSVTTYNSLSDYRLKNDLKDYSGLNLLSKIKTYDFEWIVDKTRMHGVLAHELQDIIPYAVNGQKDAKKWQSVDYSKIVPILIKAVQELNEKIERL